MTAGGPVGPAGPFVPPISGTLSLETLNQNLNLIAQILSRITNDIEGGSAQLWQPYNSLLTSIAALSATLTTGGLVQGSGLGTVAALVTGTSGQFLKSQGAASLLVWADALVSVHLQVFTSGGTYTPTTGIVASLLGAIGGGAGGGGIPLSAGTGGGGGGGAGGFSLAMKTAAQIGASQTVTIGASASGGTAGNNAGTAGNDTSIGALCVGKGGGAGPSAAANSAALGGVGGVAGTGDITGTGAPGASGNAGSAGSTVAATGSNGGSTIFGGGGLGGASGGGAGSNGSGFGSGGGGGRSFGSSAAAGGGNGAAGLAFMLEFCKV